METEIGDLNFAAPWERYPSVPRFSIGWRMGDPEVFLMEWHEKYDQLSIWRRRDYRRLHPRPFPLWFGFYAMQSRKRWVCTMGCLLTVLAYCLLFIIQMTVGPFAADQIDLD